MARNRSVLAALFAVAAVACTPTEPPENPRAQVAGNPSDQPQARGHDKKWPGESACRTGIKGRGVKPGESIPPRPYFQPFNSWITRVPRGCISVNAGQQRKWDAKRSSEGGATRYGAVWIFDLTQTFVTKDIERIYSRLLSPIRIVDYEGRGLRARLVVQSLEDCALAEFRLRDRTFVPTTKTHRCPDWP